MLGIMESYVARGRSADLLTPWVSELASPRERHDPRPLPGQTRAHREAHAFQPCARLPREDEGQTPDVTTLGLSTATTEAIHM